MFFFALEDVLKTLTKYSVKTRVALSGTMIVARDLAHARLLGRLQKGSAEGLPDYFKKYPVYYAGPAKTPEGKRRPTTGTVFCVQNDSGPWLAEWPYSPWLAE